MRGFLARRWTATYAARILKHVNRIQKFTRERRARLKYEAEREELEEKSTLIIQRFVKGYMVSRQWKEPVHRAIIDRMMVYFRKIRLIQHTNSQIIIRFAFKIYKRRKAIKAEKKRLKAEAAAKNKKKKGGRRTVTSSVAAAPSPEKKAADALAKSKVKEAEGGIIDLQVGTMKDGENLPEPEEKPEGEEG